MQPPRTLLAALLLVTAALPSVGAQAPNAVTPSTDDLGISENDVREEPSTPEDDNGFQEADPFWSPKTDPLVLDAYVVYGEGVGEDLSNVQNRAQHGDEYDDHERRMYPGPNDFAAWWGWWSDLGGGGDLRNSSLTTGSPLASNEGNGAIDDADDCRDDEWDEFTWRGANSCAPGNGHEEAPGDAMLAFVQPGTHNIHVNSAPAPTLGPLVPPAPIHDDADHDQVADFRYGGGGQGYGSPNGFARYEYDQSLLVTTQVASAVNPLETGSLGTHTTYDPYSRAADADEHAVDQDLYTALSPEIEDAYRTAVWDPPQDHGDGEDERNVLAPVHEGGAKEFVKEDGNHLLVRTSETAQAAAGTVVATVEPQAGMAYDAFFGPRPHEPNTAGDRYGVDSDGSKTSWATFDAATSYDITSDDDGDGEAEYYEPGPDQAYAGYQDAEHTWLDATTAVDVCPAFLLAVSCYHEWAHLGPSVPSPPSAGSPSRPIQDLADKGDQQSLGPGVLYVHGNLGSWHDANEDTWIGDASQGSVKAPGKHGPGLAGTGEGEPYANGLVQDPNRYESDEFRPLCQGHVTVTLRSNLDADGDGVGEWGATGVYVVPSAPNPYSPIVMDAVGDEAQPVGEVLRRDDDVGGTASIVAPDDEDGKLSRYRVEGPIGMNMVPVGHTCETTGSWDPGRRVVFPAGNPGYSFTVTTRAEALEPQVSQHGTNAGASIKGESVVDVDLIHANQDTVEGRSAFGDHPVGNG